MASDDLAGDGLRSTPSALETQAERIGQVWFTGGREKAAEVLREVMRAQVSANPFVPVRGQSFSCQQEWINRASRALTCHPEYRNTEHGDGKGWRGNHFTALCFDQQGRRCRNGGDMQRAENEGTFPVWWVWPDQIVGLLMPLPHSPEKGEG